MKAFRPFIISLAFTLMCVSSMIAQTEKPQAVNSGKIAAINFELLKDKKTGIKDFTDVYKQIEIEFKSQEDELKSLYKKMQKSLEEVKNLDYMLESRITQEFVNSKINELETSSCKLLTKQQEVKSFFDKRMSELSKEIAKKTAENLKLFAKKKSFAVILDNSQNNFYIEGEIIDVTNDFIQFYNNQTVKK